MEEGPRQKKYLEKKRNTDKTENKNKLAIKVNESIIGIKTLHQYAHAH